MDLLLDVVEGHASDVDVMCNVARALSILSAEDQDCLTLVMKQTGDSNPDRLLVKRLVDAAYTMLSFHASRRDIVVRLTFCLGTITFHRSVMIMMPFCAKKVVIEKLLTVLLK